MTAIVIIGCIIWLIKMTERNNVYDASYLWKTNTAHESSQCTEERWWKKSAVPGSRCGHRPTLSCLEFGLTVFFLGDNAWMDSVGVALFPAWVLLSWGEEPEKENNDTILLAVMLLENFGINQKMKL